MKLFRPFVMATAFAVAISGSKTQAQPASSLSPKQTPAQNAEYQQLLRLLKSPKTTGEQHRAIIIKAQDKGWLIDLIPEYYHVVQQKPDDPILLSAFGHAFSRLDEPVANRPGIDHAAYVKVSRTFYSLAHEALDKAIQGKGKSIAFCWYAAGWEHVSPTSENRREGKRQLQEALRLAPRYANARYRLAFAYLIRDADYNPNKALEEAQQAALLEPHSAKPYYYQAVAHFALKHYPLAYQLLLKAQKLEPGSIAQWMLDLYKDKANKPS